MITSEPIFKLGSDGKIRVWYYQVKDDRYRTVAGIYQGNLVESKWTVCKGKNAGKANATTDYEQALAQAVAERNKKLKREYRDNIPDLAHVPPGPMLARQWEDLKGPLNYANGVYSQPKLDGIRAIMSGKFGATTRELQPHHNCAHLLEALAPLFEQFPGIQFDGELYNHDLKDNFNKLSSLIRKQKVTASEREEIKRVVQFHIYDMPSLSMLKTSLSFGQRTTLLKSMLKDMNHPMLVYVQTDKVDNREELDDANGRYLEAGYEGQMIRLDGYEYEYDVRSTSLVKRKEFETAEFPLDNLSRGIGNWQNAAKKGIIRLEDGRLCGTGVRGTEEFLIEIMKQTDAGDMPKTVTVRYFGRTPDGMLRFPVIIDFHKDERID